MTTFTTEEIEMVLLDSEPSKQIDIIRQLLSERDALAEKVKELELNAKEADDHIARLNGKIMFPDY